MSHPPAEEPKDKPSGRGVSVAQPRISVLDYVRSMGFSYATFTQNVCAFLENSKTHQFRLALVSCAAKHERALGNKLDPKTDEGREKVWKLIAKRIHGKDDAGDKIGKAWSEGLYDAEMATLFRYFGRPDTIPYPSTKNKTQDTWARIAMARTLTYIRILPPQPEFAEKIQPFGKKVSSQLMECWDLIKTHKHYGSTKAHNINQHCMDMIYYKFSRDSDPFVSVVMDHDHLGLLRAAIGRRDSMAMPWFETWEIFRAITTGETGLKQCGWDLV